MGPKDVPEQQFANDITQVEGEPSTVGLPSTEQAPSPAMTIPPKKKSKKGLIIGLIIGAVLLLGGGAAWAYVGLVYQNPDKVMMDAILNYSSKKNVAAKVTLKTTTPIDLGSTTMSMKYVIDEQAMEGPNADMKATITLTISGIDLTVNGLVRLLDSGDLYFRIENLDTAIKRIPGTPAPDSVMKTIDKIQNKWVKVSADNLTKFSPEAGTAYQCVVTYMKDSWSNNEAVDLYKKHSFMIIDKKLDSKDGNLGYRVSVDTAKLEEYSKAAGELPSTKKMSDCVKSIAKSTGSSSSTSTTNPFKDMKVTVDFWISEWSHELKSVDYTYKITTGTTDIAYDGSVVFTYGTAQKPTAPSDSVSVYDWWKSLQSDPTVDIIVKSQSAVTSTGTSI